MAHTLTIYDTQAASSVDLAATGTSGIYLRAYAPADPRFDVSSIASLYVDGSVPIYSRSQNVIEQIVVDIRGTSADDAIAKLRSIVQAIADARYSFVNQGYNTRKELRFKPQGTTNTLAAEIVGGRVDPPSNWLDAAWNSYEINNVTITIERANWTTTASTSLYSNATAPTLGSTTISGAAGDLSGDTFLSLDATAAGFASSIAFVVGFASDALHGSTYSTSSHFGLHDASTETMGTDTSSVVDANAITGNAAQCTFATISFDTPRVTFSTPKPTRRFRIYARARVTSTPTTCTIRATSAGAYGLASYSGASETVNASEFYWYDLGAISWDHTSVADSGITLPAITLSAGRSSGTGYLNIDSIYFMPLESFVAGQATSGSIAKVSSRFGRNPQYTTFRARSMLRVPRGNSTLYWITGSGAAFRTYHATGLNISVLHWPRYLTARGAV